MSGGVSLFSPPAAAAVPLTSHVPFNLPVPSRLPRLAHSGVWGSAPRMQNMLTAARLHATIPGMAYLRKDVKHGTAYYYVCTSFRRRGRVVTKILEYIGRSPSRDRLKKARDYWGVTTRKGGGRRAK